MIDKRNDAKEIKMNKFKYLYTLSVLMLLAACATDNFGPIPEATKTGVGPTDAELIGDKASTDNVLTYGMGYDQNRYSPLRQIDKSNVKRLTPVWTAGLDNDFGEQAQPMI